MKGNIILPPHPKNMVSMLIKHNNTIDSLFPHPSKYLYDARPCIEGVPPKTNHPHNNYSHIDMPKKSNLFTSTNVAPGDQLNTQFEI